MDIKTETEVQLLEELKTLRRRLDELEAGEAERKQAEVALHKRQECLLKAEEVAHLGCWEMDIATGQSKWSDEFYRICGLEPGSVKASAEEGFKLIHPDDRERAAKTISRAIETGSEYSIEKRIVRPDGSIRYIRSIGEMLFDAAGKPSRLMGSFLDITERKVAEQALRESEVRFRTLAEHLPDVIARFDRELRHLYVNPIIEQITGISPQDFIGKTNEDLGMPADLVELWHHYFTSVFETGKAAAFTFDFPSPEGIRFFHALIVPERRNDGLVESILCVTRDITEIKGADTEREQLITELQEALAQVKQLSGLLPICSSCKKIRDDQGYWHQVEGYIQQYADVDFSHGICPDCYEELYPRSDYPFLYND